MASKRVMMTLCFAALLLVCSLLIEASNAATIQYGALKGDGSRPCKSGNCHEKPKNPYTRGCEKIDKCRHKPVKDEKGEGDEDDEKSEKKPKGPKHFVKFDMPNAEELHELFQPHMVVMGH